MVPLVVAIGYSLPLASGGGSFRSARYPVRDLVRVGTFDGPGFEPEAAAATTQPGTGTQ